jgi:DedD protein
MGLQSLFKRSASDDAPATGGDEVQQARTRARRRLIGAVLLLGIGVIGFPLLFETQPRPIPADIPIHIPRKDGQPPLALPAPKSAAAPAASSVITETAADAGTEVATAAREPIASEPPAKVALPAAPAASRPTPSAEAARAKALLEGGPTAAAAPTPKAADEAKGRFVVQVGAFADAGAARETRGKLERLGLRTYTQVVDTDAGKRIRVRVGPFASRDDAAKAADRIKSAGLPTAVLSL